MYLFYRVLSVDDDIEVESNYDEVHESFAKMGLKEPVLRGVYGYGLETPSVIQKRGIVPIIKGRDVIAQAQSGTGKTATFSVAILERIDVNKPVTQALILVPVRELAKQIGEVLKGLGCYLKLKYAVCIGGKNVRIDAERLENDTPHVVIGTPGRVLDIIQRRYIKTDSMITLVLDEADEMLSRGFDAQIRDIFERLPSNIQAVLVSATMPKAMYDVTAKFMRDPIRILLKKDELTLEGIKQYYINVALEEHKFDTLYDLYGLVSLQQVVVFCGSRTKAEELYKSMKGVAIPTSLIHGDTTQDDRDRVMGEFRSGTTRALITTDLMARGIDVQQVSVVINYDLPRDMETYLHRIGRSGRFGRKGTAISLLTNEDAKRLQEIEEFYKTTIPEMPSKLILD
jgi:translation initiation factor 4A